MVGGVFECELLEEQPGLVSVVFTGQGARDLFSKEAGGHRFQRIPPTEKRGRVQTSTITVAVLNTDSSKPVSLNMRDLEIKTSRGTGPGGQARNKTDSCVTITHIPTGVSARVDMRSQAQSKALALEILASRLEETRNNNIAKERNDTRKMQLGSGQRGDKIRTYRVRDDVVSDHRTGCTWRYSDWIRGNW